MIMRVLEVLTAWIFLYNKSRLEEYNYYGISIYCVYYNYYYYNYTRVISLTADF